MLSGLKVGGMSFVRMVARLDLTREDLAHAWDGGGGVGGALLWF
jgi:hypothetical protein